MYRLEVSFAELWKFLDGCSNDLRRRLLFKTDPSRVISLIGFKRLFRSPADFERVAVVSGGPREVELSFINAEKVDFFSYDQDPQWDLNDDWSDGRLGGAGSSYDLVLCEQVLEHVLDPQAAVKNLFALVKPGGFLHVSVPGINGVHGEPTYFYAGFHPRTLQAFMENCGFSEVNAWGWGTEKAVKMQSTCDWQPIVISGFPQVLKKVNVGRKNLLKGTTHFLRYLRKPLVTRGKFKHFSIVWAVGRKA